MGDTGHNPSEGANAGRRTRTATAVAAVAWLAFLVATVAASLAPPRPVPADAPPERFSADRAAAYLRTLATGPHPAGSAANDQVRDQLVDTLRELGLDVAVQEAVGSAAGDLSGAAGGATLAEVRNVVAVLPGSAPTGRVFLVAHYDSAQTGPGGNDDAAGVAALLEVARAAVAAPELRNDLVFVLTDAEEACLCGAAAFVADHPLAAGPAVALNLEARGSTGPVIMFETSARNGELVSAFGRAAAHPIGTSFAVEVYRLLPNDTDFTAFADAGIPGLNSAYIDGSAVYHTPLDTAASVDRASLQHHGDNALGLAREFGRADLGSALRADGDATYFPVAGLLVRYPGWLTVPLAVLALLAVAALAWLSRRSGVPRWPALAAAFGLGTVPLVVAPVAATGLWWLVTSIRPGYGALLDPYRPGVFRAAVFALAVAVLLAWYAAVRARLGATTVTVAALAWLALAGLALAFTVPGAAYLTTVPALATAVAGIATPRVRRRIGGWPAVAVQGVAAAVGVAVLLPAALLLFPALGMRMGGVAALVVVLLGFAVLPVLDPVLDLAAGLRWRPAAGLPAAAAGLAALLLVPVGLRVDRFDAAHPVPTHLMYGLDADAGRAWWYSMEDRPQPWTAQYVHEPAADLTETFPLLAAVAGEALRSGPAQAATGLPGPELTVLSDVATGDVRQVSLLLRPVRPVRLVGLYVDARTATVTGATAAGLPVRPEPAGDGRWSFGLVFHAPRPDGLVVGLELRPPPDGGNQGRVRLRVLDGSDGLGGLPGFLPRPPGVGVAGTHSSELALVTRTVTF